MESNTSAHLHKLAHKCGFSEFKNEMWVNLYSINLDLWQNMRQYMAMIWWYGSFIPLFYILLEITFSRPLPSHLVCPFKCRNVFMLILYISEIQDVKLCTWRIDISVVHNLSYLIRCTRHWIYNFDILTHIWLWSYLIMIKNFKKLFSRQFEYVNNEAGLFTIR